MTRIRGFVLAGMLLASMAHAGDSVYAPFGLVVGNSIYELPGGTAHEGLTKFGYVIAPAGSNALDGKVVASAAEYTAWREVAIAESVQNELASSRPDLGVKRVPLDQRRATGSSNPTWSFVTDQKKRKVSIRFDHKTGVIGSLTMSFAYDFPAERDEMVATMAKVCRAMKATRKDGGVMTFDVLGQKDPVFMGGDDLEAMLDRFVSQRMVPPPLHLGTGESWGDSGRPDVTIDYECRPRNLRPGQTQPDGDVTIMDVMVNVVRLSAMPSSMDRDFNVEVSRQVKAAPKVKPATTNTGGM